MHSNRFVSLLFLIFLINSCSAQQAGVSKTRSSESLADQIIRTVFEKENFPGLAIEVWKDGKSVFAKGYGYADIENQVAVDPSKSLFRIGSVSKPYTAAGLALLYQDNKVDLDAPIQNYVPSFPDKKHSVSLRQLAGHLGGIRHYRGIEFMSNKHYPNVEGGLAIFQDDELINEPGTNYSYSSYGWNLISAAMETIAEEDFLQYMDQAVFDRLDMRSTVADDNTKTIPHKVVFYERDGASQNTVAPIVDNSYKWAGGGYLSTARDMAKFGQAHLDATFIEPEVVELWTTGQTTTAGEATNYGIGWRSGEDKKGRPWFGHGGGSVGGSTMLLVFPDDNLVVAMTINLSRAKYGNLPFRVAEQFLN